MMSSRSVLINDRIKFEIEDGSLADSKEDTIVNSTGNDINLHVSVAKALLNKAGPELETACAKLIPLVFGEVKVTSGYKLPCKQIVHCNCYYWKNREKDKTRLKDMIIRCLEKAAEKDHTSIALPAVGMGVKKYPPDVVAQCITGAVREYCKNNPTSSLEKVKLYLYKPAITDAQSKVFDRRLRMLQVGAGGIWTAGAIKLFVAKGNLLEVTADVIVNSTGSQMSFSGGEKDKVSLALLNKAGKALQEECDKLKPLLSGQVVMTDGFGLPCKKVLHIQCPVSWKMGETEEELEKLMADCLGMAHGEGAASMAFPFVGTGLLKYPPEEVALCLFQAVAKFSEQHLNSCVRRILLLTHSDDTATIDEFQKYFDAMLPDYSTLEKTSDNIPVTPSKFEGKIVSDLPTFWQIPVQVYKEFVINQQTKEFEDLKADFKKTMDLTKRNVFILEAKRIQNPQTYLLYDCMRTNVAAKLRKQEHEVETAPLWHGTKEESVKGITTTHFDRGLSGEVGTNRLGANCCYFSTSSQYSDRYALANSKGEKFMILARVVTGEYCKGNEKLKQAPYKNGTEQFDSVVDDESNPTRFAVFHDAAAYPEYVIKYEFLDRPTPMPRLPLPEQETCYSPN